MYGFKEISQQLNITETQAKSKLKKAGFDINSKISESEFKLLKMSSNGYQLPSSNEKIESKPEPIKKEKSDEKVTIQSLVSEDTPLENLLEIAEMLQLDVNAISSEDAEILTELTANSIQFKEIENEHESTRQKRQKIQSENFQLELESSQLTGELNALLHHKIGEMSYEKTLLELEENRLKQLESSAHSFQSQLLKLMPKNEVIDVDCIEQKEEKNNPFLKTKQLQIKMLRG